MNENLTTETLSHGGMQVHDSVLCRTHGPIMKLEKAFSPCLCVSVVGVA
jgi:hypothetical protein